MNRKEFAFLSMGAFVASQQEQTVAKASNLLSEQTPLVSIDRQSVIIGGTAALGGIIAPNLDQSRTRRAFFSAIFGGVGIGAGAGVLLNAVAEIYDASKVGQ